VAEDLRAWARVDLARLAANYRAVAASCAVPLMPVVKADAYGHGADRVGRVLESLGAPMLAVAYHEEGVALRRAGIRVPILVLTGCFGGQEQAFADHGLTPVVSTPATAQGALAAGRTLGRPLPVHLKVDTGMGRLGLAPDDVVAEAERLGASGLVELVGLTTHLSSADEDAEVTERQLDVFDEVLARLAARGIRPRLVHVAHSAGLSHLRPTHTLARPGLLLYGLKPRPLSPAIDVSPVMTVAARIALVKDVPPGAAISYGGRWVARRPSRIATVCLGYADGVPRTRGMIEEGAFSVAGRRAPVAGTVCMDLVMLDVTEVPGASEGGEAVLFGDDPTAWDVGGWAGTNAWEVLTRVGPRVPRVYVGDAEAPA